MSEKELCQKARKEDALMYISALVVIVGGLLIFPVFGLGSIIPTMIVIVWSIGVIRFNKKKEEHLLSVVDREHNPADPITSASVGPD